MQLLYTIQNIIVKFQDHGGAGTVQSVNSDGWVTVKWDQDSTTNTYRMGAENSYDLMLAP